MHPILAGRARLLAYLLMWLPLGALVAWVVAASSGQAWTDAAAVMLPACLIYAPVCLSPWYLCRVLPLGGGRMVRLVASHLGAALVAASVLAGLAWLWSGGLPLDAALPAVTGMGLLLYLMSVGVHYAVLSARREVEARVLAREAELRELQAQVNPHFLFNSLNAISGLTASDPAGARRMCVLLGDFLRGSLALGGSESVPLERELELARGYIEIEQARFGDRLRLEESVEESALECPVPPLLLQPLVENAVRHGIAGLIEGGTVRLEARQAKTALWIALENPVDAEAPPPRSGGLGLANVRRRLEVRYAGRAEMRIIREATRFRVELRLPS